MLCMEDRIDAVLLPYDPKTSGGMARTDRRATLEQMTDSFSDSGHCISYIQYSLLLVYY